MKILASIVFTGMVFVLSASSVQALPFNMADNNPQVVAYYEDGPHGIPGESEHHEGEDLVKRNGNSGSFQQWFYGTSESEGEHGEHSLWKVSKDGTCPSNAVMIFSDHDNPDNFWGDYLEDDTYYCVKTNDFKPSK